MVAGPEQVPTTGETAEALDSTTLTVTVLVTASLMVMGLPHTEMTNDSRLWLWRWQLGRWPE